MKHPRVLALMSLLSLLFGLARAEPLQVGAQAPDVAAVTDDGKTISLRDVYRQQPYTLIYFYPKADTPGCTKQGCSLRDANADLAKKGVKILGVSTDSIADQKAFKEKYHFPFTLLADTDKKVMQAFGQTGGNRAAREAYLINREGKVVYHDKGQTTTQAEKVLEFLNTQKT